MRTLVRASSPSSALTVPFTVLFMALAACSTAPDAAPPVESSTASPAPTVAAPLGRYAFVLRESAVLAKIEARCQATPDVKACMAEIEAEAAREGIRLSLDPAGRLVWTSYGLEPDGTETVFLEATLDATWDATSVTGKVVGPLRGRDAQGADFVGLSLVRIDERTVAMQDPRKGKLVFRKS
jgi:hypothetical protein